MTIPYTILKKCTPINDDDDEDEDAEDDDDDEVVTKNDFKL